MEEKALIAEFDRLSKQLHLYEHPITGEYVNPEDLEYDTDWNMLMPVVEKIIKVEGLDFNNTPKSLTMHQLIFNHSLSVNYILDISLMYKAAVEFIKWYNLNKP